jgi:spermidine synthase
MVAAILGILLTIQINYKLEWTIVETALKWHVHFGITLSVVAIIHLSWHLGYYIEIFKRNKTTAEKKVRLQKKGAPEINNLKSLILVSGFASTVIQVLLIREISTVFQGNELLMGWTIGAWMLFTGTGAILGRNQRQNIGSPNVIQNVLMLIGILPLCFVIFMNLFRNIIFPPGILINPAHFLLILLLILSPVGLLSGYLFALLVGIYRKERSGYIKVYAVEAIGSLAGGLVVSLAFIYWFSIIQSLLLVFLIILLTLFLSEKKTGHFISGTGIIVILILSFILPVDNYLKSFLFINQEVIQSKETYYGNITITSNADQFNIYENGILSFTTDNIIIREEYAHYAMLQKTDAENVLVIGGGIAGTLSEILKYPSVENIDYVESNPQLIRTVSDHIPFPVNEKINMIYGDGRRFLNRTGTRYDIAILAIPDPASLQSNRYYTQEFISILKMKLNKNAVIMLSHTPAGNYVDSESARIEGTIYNTLKNEFQNVKIIPGENDYFLASDSLINIHISDLASDRSVENAYVNQYYMDDASIGERSRYIEQNIIKQNIINSDKRPLPVFFHTLKFLSQFNQQSIFYLLLPVLILILPVFFMRTVSVGIFVTGFTGSAIELLLIFSFQTFYGYVYSAIGLIIAVFMGGLAFGSLLGSRIGVNRKHFLLAQGFLITYALLFPLFWDLQTVISGGFFQLFIFFTITFLLAAIVGFQYVAGTSIYKAEISKAATTLYGADLLGSSLGVITITLVLLPVLGMQKSCLVIAGLNIGALVLNLFRKT